MTAAVVTLAVALTAAVGGLIALAVAAISAERRCGDARADESALAVRFESMTAQRDAESRRADDEKERANALDDLLADAAVTGPVLGAYDRLLQTWRARRAPSSDGARAVPTPAPTADPGPDDLVRPGEG